MKKLITFTVVAIVLIASCKKDSGPYFVTPKGTSVNPVSFSKDIQPIFTTHCVGCHDEMHVTGLDLQAGTSYSKLVNVTSFNYAPAVRVKPSDAAGSVLWNKDAGTGVYGNQMPLGGPYLQQFEMDLIKKWINEGALNN